MLVTVSCSDELGGERAPISSESNLHVLVPTVLSSRGTNPDDASGLPTYNATVDECQINDLSLYAFPTGNEGKLLVETLPAPLASMMLEEHVANYQLNIEPGTYHIYVVANMNKVLSGKTIQTEDDLKKIVLNYEVGTEPGMPVSTNIPMIYEPKDVNGNIINTKIEKSGKKYTTVAANLKFTCVKVKLNLLFDPTAEGSAFNGNSYSIKDILAQKLSPSTTLSWNGAFSNSNVSTDYAKGFENEVYAGIPEMLKTLQSKGYFLAVASSKPQVYVERILEHFDLKKYFVVVVGSELDGRRETKDQVVQETLRQLFGENPVDPAQVYMIGDRKFDVEGARALGVESVGVTYGYGSKEELKEAKADYIVQSVEELEKFLLRGSEELLNGNPDNKKKNPMYQRIWTMVYSFLMFILVRNAVQYALLALLYQLAQSGASGGLVDLLILRDETGAYNGYSGDVSSIIAALGFIGGAIAVWSTAKMLIDKNKEDMHLSHLKKEGKSKYVLLTVATIGAVIGCNLLFELLGVTNKSEAYTEVAAQQYSAHFIVGILVFGFISPIAEELLFRGVIYGYLRRFMDIKLAIALSALIFGVYHMNYVQGVYGFLIGCLMAYAYEYFGEFKMAVFVHVASNVLAYCLSYTAIAVTGFVSWPVCVIFLAVAVVSLGMLHKQKNIF